MTPKEKATEMVRNQFDIIAKALNYKGLKKEGKNMFYAIEIVSKQCALICVDEILNCHIWKYNSIELYKYWQKVKQEIEKL